MSAAGEAILKLLLIGEDKSASAALGKVAAKAKQTGDESKKHLGGIGAAMGALGGLAAAAGVVSFGKNAIDTVIFTTYHVFPFPDGGPLPVP